VDFASRIKINVHGWWHTLPKGTDCGGLVSTAIIIRKSKTQKREKRNIEKSARTWRREPTSGHETMKTTLCAGCTNNSVSVETNTAVCCFHFNVLSH
jgi:hypothetical protein